jgi:hypothetical protein
VEVPAEYRDVTREVVETPAATREVEVPAAAVREFQRSRGRPMDSDRHINMATVRALGVMP